VSSEEHYRRLERMYLNAPCNAYYKPALTIGGGVADLTIPITENLYHAAGAAHGSVYFKAADDSAFFAVNSLVEDVFVLTTNLNVHLLRPIAGGDLRACARVVFRSKRLYLAESILEDSDGNEVGRASATFVPSKMPLTSDMATRNRVWSEAAGQFPCSIGRGGRTL